MSFSTIKGLLYSCENILTSGLVFILRLFSLSTSQATFLYQLLGFTFLWNLFHHFLARTHKSINFTNKILLFPCFFLYPGTVIAFISTFPSFVAMLLIFCIEDEISNKIKFLYYLLAVLTGSSSY